MKHTQRLVQLLFLAALIAGSSASAAAQEQQVVCKDAPAAVLAAFAKAFPKATIKGCSKEAEKGQTVYEVTSVEDKTRRDVTYTADGKLVLVEESIDISALPPEVKAALDKEYPGGKILRSEKVTRGTVVGYEFGIEHKGKRMEIVFDPKGNHMKI